MITDGRVLGDSKESRISDLEIQNFVERAIFAALIPRAWSMSNKGYRPFILDSGKPCQDGKPVEGNPVKSYITDKVAKGTSVCYEGHSYFFVSATGKYDRCNPSGVTSCSNAQFKGLPGMQSLDEGTFGNVNKTDLVIG